MEKHILIESGEFPLPAVKYKCSVKVFPLLKICVNMSFGSLFAVPTVKSNAADSPIIFPADSIKAVEIPGKAHGKIKLKITLNLLAPSAKAPFLYEMGTANIDSLDVSIMLGRTEKDIVKHPAKIDGPRPKPIQKRLYPKSPIKIEGILAKIFVEEETI